MDRHIQQTNDRLQCIKQVRRRVVSAVWRTTWLHIVLRYVRAWHMSHIRQIYATHGKYIHISDLEVLVLYFSISIFYFYSCYFRLYLLCTFRFYIQSMRQNWHVKMSTLQDFCFSLIRMHFYSFKSFSKSTLLKYHLKLSRKMSSSSIKLW